MSKNKSNNEEVIEEFRTLWNYHFVGRQIVANPLAPKKDHNLGDFEKYFESFLTNALNQQRREIVGEISRFVEEDLMRIDSDEEMEQFKEFLTKLGEPTSR